MDIGRFKAVNSRLLELTDELGLHREAVVVRLDFVGDGSLEIVDGKRIEFTPPEHGDVDGFVVRMRQTLVATDLSSIPKA